MGVDLPMVRRGNVFFVPSDDDPSVTQSVFAYGDEGDEVYIGDWDGNNIDTIAIRRGNEYFVKNDNRTTGVADHRFSYGDPDDEVLVGNWNGMRIQPQPDRDFAGKGDTLIARRGNEYFVKNDLITGTAAFTFFFGDPDDEVLVGDWAEVVYADGELNSVRSGGRTDQLAVRRGNQYFLSSEISEAGLSGTNPRTLRTFFYGDPDDDVFVAAFPTPIDADDNVVDDVDTATEFIHGDGLGVRRSS
jgi:hypothetical protein